MLHSDDPEEMLKVVIFLFFKSLYFLILSLMIAEYKLHTHPLALVNPKNMGVRLPFKPKTACT